MKFYGGTNTGLANHLRDESQGRDQVFFQHLHKEVLDRSAGFHLSVADEVDSPAGRA
jgi:hypothetical protein